MGMYLLSNLKNRVAAIRKKKTRRASPIRRLVMAVSEMWTSYCERNLLPRRLWILRPPLFVRCVASSVLHAGSRRPETCYFHA